MGIVYCCRSFPVIALEIKPLESESKQLYVERLVFNKWDFSCLFATSKDSFSLREEEEEEEEEEEWRMVATLH